MSLPSPPYTDPVVSETTRQARSSWLKWFELIQRAINIGSAVLGQVSLSAQTASIAATSINTPTLTAGVYQVLVTHRVTTADGVSSSLTPFVTVTESGGTRTYTGAANTSNSTAVGKTDTFNVLSDAGAAIKYGTTYVSGGGGPVMQYRLTVRVVQIPGAR